MENSFYCDFVTGKETILGYCNDRMLFQALDQLHGRCIDFLINTSGANILSNIITVANGQSKLQALRDILYDPIEHVKTHHQATILNTINNFMIYLKNNKPLFLDINIAIQFDDKVACPEDFICIDPLTIDDMGKTSMLSKTIVRSIGEEIEKFVGQNAFANCQLAQKSASLSPSASGLNSNHANFLMKFDAESGVMPAELYDVNSPQSDALSNQVVNGLVKNLSEHFGTTIKVVMIGWSTGCLLISVAISKPPHESWDKEELITLPSVIEEILKKEVLVFYSGMTLIRVTLSDREETEDFDAWYVLQMTVPDPATRDYISEKITALKGASILDIIRVKDVFAVEVVNDKDGDTLESMNAEFMTAITFDEAEDSTDGNIQLSGEDSNPVHSGGIMKETDTLIAHVNNAFCLQKKGEFDKAIEIYKEIYEQQKIQLGADHSHTLATRYNIASCLLKKGEYYQAIDVYKEVLEIEKNRLDNQQSMWETYHGIASCLQELGDYNEAVSIYKEILEHEKTELGYDHLSTLATQHGIASCLQGKGEHNQAINIYKEIFEVKKSKLGCDDPSTLATQHGIASCLQEKGENNLAIDIYKEVFEREKAMLGCDHPSTLATRHNIASCLKGKGEYDEAIDIYEKVLELQKNKLGTDHPFTLVTRHNIASCLRKKNEYSLAIDIYREVFELQKNKLGVDHPSTLATRHNIASCLQVKGEFNDAIDIYEKVLELKMNKLGSDHPSTLATRNSIASCLRIKDEYYQSTYGYKEAPVLLKSKLGKC